MLFYKSRHLGCQTEEVITVGPRNCVSILTRGTHRIPRPAEGGRGNQPVVVGGGGPTQSVGFVDVRDIDQCLVYFSLYRGGIVKLGRIVNE